MNECESLIETAKHEERLSRFINRYSIISLFAERVRLWKNLAFLIVILVYDQSKILEYLFKHNYSGIL